MGAWSLDLASDRVTADARSLEIYGVADDPPSDRSGFLALTHPEDLQTLEEALSRATDASDGAELDLTYRVVVPAGDTRWIKLRGRALYESQSRRAVRLSGIVRDVTERMRTQQALRQSEEHLRIAVEAAGLGTWSVDPRTQVTTADARVRELFGMPPDASDLAEFLAKIHPDDRDRVSATIGRSLDPADPLDPYEAVYRVHPRPGKVRWIEARGETIFEGEGPTRVAVHFSGILRDVTQQKQLEGALRESEENLRVALGASQLGFWFVDPHTRRTTVDARVGELWGFEGEPPSDLNSYVERLHPDDQPLMRAAVARSLDPDEPNEYSITYRVHPEPGAERWIEARGETLFEGEGASRHALRFTGVLRDVTDRHQIEEALRRSEAHHRIALDAAELGTWSIDLDGGGTMTLDARSADLFDLPAATALDPMEVFGRLHPDDQERTQRAAQAAMDSGTGTYAITHRIVLPSGTERWIESRGRVFFEGEGDAARPMQFTGTVRDVTEQKRTTEALAESEARLRTIFERIDEGYCLAEMIVDDDGEPQSYRFIEVNPLFSTLSGLQNPEGRTIHELVPGVERSWVETYARVAFGGETVRFEQESPAMGIWFDVFATPVEPRGRFAIVFRNITERRRAENEVRQREAELRALNETLEARVAERTAQLEQRNRELHDFAHAASHDLQEPLRKISTFAGMLADEHGADLDEDGRYFVERIRSAALRLGTLVRDLLAFSRVGTQAESTQRVDLGVVAAQVADDLSLAIRDAGADVRIEPMPTVVADAAQMRQLIQNLVENAVKYRREGEAPQVRVWAETKPKAVRLMVSDNGIGIPAKHRDRVFAPFGRLHGRGEYSGSGIGLAICRRIAERHGGIIDFGATPGGGTTFVVTLPQPR
jgi:PAS domain S-box-containing protein